MIVLGLDSSAKTAGVAVLRDGELLFENYLAAGFTHSETLLELVDAALRACRLTVGDVGCFAVTAGPGSFTGLRIGLALVKGLAEPGQVPCVPVSTLEALAAECGVPGTIVAAMDARRGEVYTARFSFDGERLCRLTPDDAMPAAEAAQGFAGAKRPVTLAGDGATLCLAAAEGQTDVRIAAVRPAASAAACARLGAAALAEGRAMDAARLTPVYHRLCQAERERAERLAKN